MAGVALSPKGTVGKLSFMAVNVNLLYTAFEKKKKKVCKLSDDEPGRRETSFREKKDCFQLKTYGTTTAHANIFRHF